MGEKKSVRGNPFLILQGIERISGRAGVRGKGVCLTGQKPVLAGLGRAGEMKFQGGRIEGRVKAKDYPGGPI